MRFVRFDDGRGARVGVARGDRVVDLTARFGTMAALLAAGEQEVRAAAEAEAGGPPLAEVRLLAPVDPDARILCAAFNYREHLAEMGRAQEAPPVPILFLKPTSALVGPDEPIRAPAITAFLDYEAELAVVIGRGGANIPLDDALAHVGGYTCFNDVTARDLQLVPFAGQMVYDWFSAKCADGTTPIGPWIVPASRVPDPGALRLRLRRNGEVLQNAPASLMIRSVAELVAFASTRVALRPGDVIATGTPSGVGKARGVRLAPGDHVEVEIEGVGTLRNRVVAA